MKPWLAIVGIGEDGVDGLAASTRALVDSAEILAGGTRHLSHISRAHPAQRLAWTTPFDRSVAALRETEGRRVVVLASGDPMHYGVGATLARELPEAIAAVIPAPSAFSLAAARLRWPLHEVDCLSLHGRPAETLYLHVSPGARLLILSADADTPARVAGMLTARGYGPSRISVFERMGGAQEARRDALAHQWGDGPVASLNTIAVECVAGPGAARLARIPGLPDDAFEHDGMITKREIRAVTLAALAPQPGQLLWDIGAGSGSVAVEWMRAGGRAIAVEHDRDRAAMAARNALTLGVPQLDVVVESAPAALAGLEAPDAVFVGGGITTAGVFDRCWNALVPGGRLVANAVTIEGESALAALRREHGGDLVRLAVSRLSPVGTRHGWRPSMTVTQWSVDKR